MKTLIIFIFIFFVGSQARAKTPVVRIVFPNKPKTVFEFSLKKKHLEFSKEQGRLSEKVYLPQSDLPQLLENLKHAQMANAEECPGSKIQVEIYQNRRLQRGGFCYFSKRPNSKRLKSYVGALDKLFAFTLKKSGRR